jgi:hypothetical protein
LNPVVELRKQGVMTATDATSAFQAMVAQYEDTGWEVRAINQAALRATVRRRAAPVDDHAPGAPARVIAVASRCRKVWVDGMGAVQETNVPC